MPLPRFITGFNKHVTNRLFLIFAGWLPPFAVISHVGRRSGRVYRTPVLTFQTGEGYVVALTYGRDVDWVRNLLAAGHGEVERGGLSVPVSSFRVASYGDEEGLFSFMGPPSTVFDLGKRLSLHGKITWIDAACLSKNLLSVNRHMDQEYRPRP